MHEGLVFICCCLFQRLSSPERMCSLDYLERRFIRTSLARSSWMAGHSLASSREKGLYWLLFSFGSPHRWFWSPPPPPKNFSKMTPKFFLAEVIIPGKQFTAALIMMTALMGKIIILNGSYSVPCDELVITMKCIKQPKVKGKDTVLCYKLRFEEFQNWVGHRAKWPSKRRCWF